MANAQVTEALEKVYQARAALGLPGKPPEGTGVTDVPANLDQTFSSVRQALGELMESAAQLGVVPSSYDLTPRQVVDEFYRRDPGGDINRIYAAVIKNAPALKQAQAGLSKHNAISIRRSWSLVTVRHRRNRWRGHPTERQPGQQCGGGPEPDGDSLAPRIWIDANFKETQLATCGSASG